MGKLEMAKKIKHPRTVFRKLGRERTVGSAEDFGRLKIIVIDPEIAGIDLLDTFIHERLHFLLPDLHERKDEDHDTVGVEEVAEILADYLWIQGYRKIDDGANGIKTTRKK